MTTTGFAQAPPAVVMVRPHRFRPNPQTALDNRFQQQPDSIHADEAAARARAEAEAAAAALHAEGVQVHLFDDFGEHDTPDSVFPNNWFSTHADGRVVLYPMMAANRRRERRLDVLEHLRAEYQVSEVVDLSGFEAQGRFLEGTGALVLDAIDRVAYVALSRRADAFVAQTFCDRLGYEPAFFETQGPGAQPVYHTNVLMCLGTRFALVGFSLFSDAAQVDAVRHRLLRSGRQLVELSPWQIGEFAGNAIELAAGGERVLALSQRAYDSLSREQRHCISQSARLLPLAVPTIEQAGGSVRCMLAGIHLPPAHGSMPYFSTKARSTT